jgi:hypothetical protein
MSTIVKTDPVEQYRKAILEYTNHFRRRGSFLKFLRATARAFDRRAMSERRNELYYDLDVAGHSAKMAGHLKLSRGDAQTHMEKLLLYPVRPSENDYAYLIDRQVQALVAKPNDVRDPDFSVLNPLLDNLCHALYDKRAHLWPKPTIRA